MIMKADRRSPVQKTITRCFVNSTDTAGHDAHFCVACDGSDDMVASVMTALNANSRFRRVTLSQRPRQATPDGSVWIVWGSEFLDNLKFWEES